MFNYTFEFKIATKYISLHHSAGKRNKKFNLRLSDIRKLLQRKTCFYTGVSFEKKGNNARSVDCVTPSLGYTQGNVVACTVRVNKLKADLDPNDIIKIGKALQKHLKLIK